MDQQVPIVRKLAEDVVNRIAAGEVIQRPANALKELLENSLDAKSTNIQVTLKNGGLKLLQIQDNGTGIRTEDLGIVCERFTTSKLQQFEDLTKISTYGFRGEALASISHVAHLTITTKTNGALCAYKGLYKDGKLKAPPKSCAGNVGTIITVEDLFHNIATRKKSMKSFNEEHLKVVEVVSRYAIHNPLVGFTVKKQGELLTEVKTNQGSTHIDNIQAIYGSAISRALLEVNDYCNILKVKIKGYVSNPNFSAKKQIFILFINDRLVDSQGLRKAVDQVYSIYLAKGSHPFIYLSLHLDPMNVDVNVHPTKHEVHFLHEDKVIDKVVDAIQDKLSGTNTSRTFYTQTRLPMSNDTLIDKSNEKIEIKESQKLKITNSPNVSQSKMVRTDCAEQKIDKFLNTSNSSNSTLMLPKSKTNDVITRREIKLTSVLSLRKEIENRCSETLQTIFQNHKYVGAASPTWSLFQHDTNLYICNSNNVLQEMFYQIMMYEFGNFGVIQFSNALSIYELIMIALELSESGYQGSEDKPKEELARDATEILTSRASMLNDYFSIEIDTDANILSIPLLLEGFLPDLDGLPLYLLRLASEVDWSSEKQCFLSFCRETARFYILHPWKQQCSDNDDISDAAPDRNWAWSLEHVLYPSLRKSFQPPRHFLEDGTLLQIASLPDMYKVFERC
ncbi:DNA mismatch repair protein Mlh1 [Myzus persicae]|uniref:DNA mismatch repair protein Mlh1 n=1 Tax=Myzus persicae TaxID=13164 RepID=UPI000B92FD59|nr:DNA mismatch repair protein Mlh1 [Myzus persicae]XP_022168582.1 DNA mismatch repair protein Mlh1 [Myzus persicae]XP_022168583.1 DNA mismatch repair protein Mlh1 [Myzus persicae]XP_022168584.1 DNA mismatch repair protein Mlh1 [Myzus persicae]